jgi:hypothetical protein
MPDLDHVLVDTEDFLRRQLGSSAAREAHKRRLQRGVGEAFRRVRRAALLFVLLLLTLIVVDVAGASLGFITWLVAFPTLVLASAVSLLWPTRQGRAPQFPVAGGRQSLGLEVLAGRCADALLERCRELPRPALPAADTILNRLRDLQPHLGELPEGSPAAGEARRLIGEHLPRLVDTYLALPPSARTPGSESDRRIAESLDIVADELNRLCEQLDSCRTSAFETQRRFIETRYGEG